MISNFPVIIWRDTGTSASISVKLRRQIPSHVAGYREYAMLQIDRIGINFKLGKKVLPIWFFISGTPRRAG